MSSNSPCAACKCLRRKCTPECVFAPYFPPDNPQKFTSVHKVFGASNVSKILNELSIAQRREAVNSLAYEAESRLKDPIYGCVGLVAILQNRLKQVQHDLVMAKKELATYIGPSAMLPMINHHPGLLQQPATYQPMPMPTGIPHGAELMITEHHQQQQQFLEAQQLAATRERELLRNYAHQQEQQQKLQHQHQLQLQQEYQKQLMHQQNYHLNQHLQNDLLRFNSGFSTEAGGSVTATGFNQITGADNEYGEAGGSVTATGFNQIPVGSSYHNIQRQEPSPLTIQMQELFLEEQQQASLTNTQQQPTRSTKSDEERSIGPSS